MKHPTNLQGPIPAPIAVAQTASSSRLALARLAWSDRIFLILLVLVSVNYFAGLRGVPFHPDESTQIFMSADLDLLFSHPAQLLWSATPSDPLMQHYRELDAPLARYLIGAGRWLGRLAPLPSDWDWSKTWSANALSGALPPDALLLTARQAVAWLFPFSLLLVYLGCRRAGHPWAGVVACAILGFSPLVLVHTRRAMAESGLLFGSALIVWIFSSRNVRPWIAGLIGGIALAAKQSAVGLLLPVLVAVALPETLARVGLKPILLRLGEALAALALLTFLLNPYLWSSPIQAARAALVDRQDLAARQTADYRGELPGGSISPLTQTVVVLGQVYLAPPQFEETGNYIADTAAQKQAYLANPFNDLLTGPVWGSVFFFLTLAGIGLSILNFRRSSPADRLWLGLLLLAAVGEFIILCVTLPLPFQRYVIPLMPLICIWSGLGVERIAGIFKNRPPRMRR
jgi:hypothetical protein